MRYQAFAFDLDGTLIDSQIDFVSMRQDLGLTQDQPVLESIENWPDEKKRQAHQIIHDHEMRGALASTKIEDACEFLENLKRQGVPIAIFTRNSRETAIWSMKRHEIEAEILISRDDGKPKPDPEGLLKIIKTFRIERTQLLFVGDYLYDLQAGIRAGVATALYLPTPADFDTGPAQFTFERYTELKEWINLR